MSKGERRRVGPVMKLFIVLFGLAGLGMGVWVFGRRRRGSGWPDGEGR